MKPAGLIERIVSTLIFTAALVISLPTLTWAQMTPELKADIEVAGDYVRLGDLFEHAGASADVRVFKAPEPGGSGTVNADRLVRVAHGHGIGWTNPDRIPEVRVARSGLLISEAEIKDLIAETLHERLGSGHSDGSFDISFNSDQAPLYVSSNEMPTAEVIQLRYSRRSGVFSVMISAPAGDPAARHRAYSGRALEVALVPVPVHRLRRGDVIAEDSVEMQKVPLRRIESTTMTAAEDLVGMAVKRSLRAGEPVRARDIERPRLVHKNADVMVQHKGPGLLLTVRATALQSGALGDIIDMRNATSHRGIQGKVIGPDLVEALVGGPKQLARTD